MQNRIQSLLEVLIVGVVGIFLISACGRADRSSAVSNINLSGNAGQSQTCLMILHPDQPDHCQQ